MDKISENTLVHTPVIKQQRDRLNFDFSFQYQNAATA